VEQEEKNGLENEQLEIEMGEFNYKWA